MSAIIDLASHYLLTQFGGDKTSKKWSTFTHHGVVFAPLYVPHNIPIKYNGKSIRLPPLAEEYATLYAKYIDSEYATLYAKYIDSEYAKNKVFSKNFFKSWKTSIKGLGIEKIDLCDFTDIIKHLLSMEIIVLFRKNYNC